MTDTQRLRESLLDLHDLDHHFQDREAGEGCEDCLILLEPLTSLTTRLEQRDEQVRNLRDRWAECRTRLEQAEEALADPWIQRYLREKSTGEPSLAGWEVNDPAFAALAYLGTQLEQAEGALREAHRGIAFVIAAAGGEVRVPRSVMLNDYTVTRLDSPIDDDVRFTAALSTIEPTKGEP